MIGTDIEILQISFVKSSVGNGITDPHYASIGSMNCVIKSINNPESHLALFNEYIGYCIGSKLGLTLPKFGFAIIHEDTEFEDGVEMELFNCGSICFYTEVVEKVALLNSPNQLKQANKKELIAIVIYDCLICNKDRNRGNLLLQKLKGQPLLIYPIDYTHAFELQVVWDCLQLARFVNTPFEKIDLNLVVDQFIHTRIKESHLFYAEEVSEIADYFKRTLELVDLNSIISCIPTQILKKISETDLNLFKEFMYLRFSSIDEINSFIVCKLCNGGGQL